MSNRRELYDPRTGEIIVWREPNETFHQPVGQRHHPPMQHYDPYYDYVEPSPRESRRRDSKARLAANVTGLFMLSFVAAGLGAPAITFVMWALIAAMLMYRAVR